MTIIDIIRDGEGGKAKPWTIRARGGKSWRFADDKEQAIRILWPELVKNEGLELQVVIHPEPERPAIRWRVTRVSYSPARLERVSFVMAPDKRNAVDRVYAYAAPSERGPVSKSVVYGSVEGNGWTYHIEKARSWDVEVNPEPIDPLSL